MTHSSIVSVTYATCVAVRQDENAVVVIVCLWMSNYTYALTLYIIFQCEKVEVVNQRTKEKTVLSLGVSMGNGEPKVGLNLPEEQN